MFSSGARLINVGLAILAGALAFGFAYITEWGERLLNPVVLPGEPTAKSPLQGVDVLPDFKLSGEAAAYNVISQRPLLNPTRAPAPTAAVIVTTEPPKPQIRRGLYELLGVSEIGSTRVAQLRENATRRVVSARVGDNLQELKVEKITPDGVVLAFQNEKDEIRLARFTASSRVPQPPPPQAPPAVPPTPQQQPQVASAQPVPVPQSPVASPTNVAGYPPAGGAPAAASPPPVAAVEPNTPEVRRRQQMLRQLWNKEQ